jgi:hypothetical protein
MRLPIGETLTNNTTDRNIGASNIIDPKCDAIVVTKIKFRRVTL